MVAAVFQVIPEIVRDQCRSTEGDQSCSTEGGIVKLLPLPACCLLLSFEGIKWRMSQSWCFMTKIPNLLAGMEKMDLDSEQL